MKAVIIAAGTGSRLESKHNGFPKTLLEVKGKKIIDIILEAVLYSGVNEVVIITGFKSHLLENYFKNNLSESISIEFLYNPNWKMSNGISVLKAKEVIQPDEQFILLMSDHIFHPVMLKEVVNTPIQSNQALLALDFKISSIPDLDDGMKVQCKKQSGKVFTITKLGKSLNTYQSIDCGMFKLNYSFFQVLEDSIANGKDSLSDACNALTTNYNMLGLDIEEKRWIDLDTPKMFSFTSIIDEIVFD